MDQGKRKHDASDNKESSANDDAKYRRIGSSGDMQPHRVKALSNAEQVAAHYNSRRELGVQGRLHTAITGLRIFNNWVKSIIIRQSTFRGCKVLDLGCGKGGDLRKWSFSNIGEYVGMDIADVSVKQAHARYLEMKKPIFPARFFVQDCYGEPLEQTLQPSDYQADVISAQFCLHYAFESEKKARQMMHNVSSHLVPGGRFIFTIPNANWLIKKLRNSSDNSFGNSVYRVEFQRREPITRFGFPYSFTLDEAVEDCTEYIVHFPSLVTLAEEHGMRLVSRVPFHEFYASMINDPTNVRLLERMGVVTSDRPALTDDEWEAVGIYMAVTLEKV